MQGVGRLRAAEEHVQAGLLQLRFADLGEEWLVEVTLFLCDDLGWRLEQVLALWRPLLLLLRGGRCFHSANVSWRLGRWGLIKRLGSVEDRSRQARVRSFFLLPAGALVFLLLTFFLRDGAT